MPDSNKHTGIEYATRDLLNHLGFNLADPNFKETPQRVAKFYKSFVNIERPEIKVFPTSSKELVLIKGHIAWSLCPHHLLPVKYEVKVGYICDGLTFGLSKMARIVDYHASKLPLQEDLALMVLKDLKELLNPPGYGIVIKGEHMCMQMRGVKSNQAVCITNALRGQLLFNPASRQEFLAA